ncbi:hypothetical protein COY91_02340 [Candidatus Shapirobacteria bacterium CG_4_10_14_0_8_um_filter_39_15]|nr:MAG: hypothetical protein COY91_02340 [Candidatus Shapirobacteria bacterium CG_4_10_14_0_8_um_filter_39_15]PJE68210.1 MAG: hypothetical protein COU94_03055 [Candidatus Shapirobacteria bacterium CG10_big_fil_rev_8_21_14_0_10_38_8]
MNNRNHDFGFSYFLTVCLLALIVMAETLVIISQQINLPIVGNNQVGQGTVTPTPLPIRSADSLGTLSFVLVNQNQVKLVFNSPKIPVGGVDAVLLFDPKAVKISKITPDKNVFTQFAVNDKQALAGRIKITAYYPQRQLTGTQTVAVLDLQFLQKISTSLRLEFKGEQQTIDSNLVSQIDQRDILGKVIPLILNQAQ